MRCRIDSSWNAGGVRSALRRCCALAAAACLLAAAAQPAAAQQALTASGTSFGTLYTNQSVQQQVTLTSTTDDINLQLLQVAQSGFSVSDQGTCTQFTTLTAGSSCTMTIHYQPGHPGYASAPVPISAAGGLMIQYYDYTVGGFHYQNFLLSGSGTYPQSVVTPGVVSDLVGSDAPSLVGFAGDRGYASSALFAQPSALMLGGLGTFYIADTGNNVVRAIYNGLPLPNVFAPQYGYIYTIAGVAPTGGGSTAGPGLGDGYQAIYSPLNAPGGLALDVFGNVYIADTNNNAVRMVNAQTGVITTVAGTLNSVGTPGASFSGDGGPATSALLYSPTQITLDGNGNLYIADANNNAVRVVYAAGNIPNLTNPTPGYIYTVAGGPGNAAQPNNGDGGPATSANLNFPTGVMVDSSGNIYVADQHNQAVRRVDAVTGNISSVYSGPDSPVTLSVDAADDIYFTLHTSCSVAQYNPTTQVSGMPPVTTIVAGNGSCTASGDGGVATAAGFSAAEGIVVDTYGNLDVLEADGVRQVGVGQPSMNFGSVNVGTISAPQTAFITDDDILPLPNTGNYQQDLINLSVVEGYQSNYVGPAPFGIVPYAGATQGVLDCSGSSSGNTYVYLRPGQSCGASLVFEPYLVGGQPASYTQGGASINLTGTGTGSLPTAVLSGTPVNFTSVVYEVASATQAFTLTNTSNVALQVLQVYFGSFNNGFSETDTCQTTYAPGYVYPSLAPGQSCTITVSFLASKTGNTSNVLYVQDNASSGGGIQSIALTGSGTAPLGVLTPNPLTLNAGPGSSNTQTITFSNTGTATLHYNQYSFTITGDQPAEFAITQNLCTTGTLVVGASCTLQVTFTPPNYGYYTANVNVQDDSGGVRFVYGQYQFITQSTSLRGATGNPVQGNGIAAANTAFPATAVGSSVTQTVTLTLGRATALNSVAMAPGFNEYSIGTITGCVVDGATVNAAGTVCQVPVTFAPAGPGVRTAPLSVIDVEGGQRLMYAFGLTGSGLGPLAVLTPGIITTVVGGAHGYGDGIVGADGPAVNTRVGFTGGMAMDAAGDLYLADTQNTVIWKTDPSGNIHIYAGSPTGIYSQPIAGDGGVAAGAELSYISPQPLALDAKGGLYIGDNAPSQYNEQSEIRYVDGATNLITNYAGFTYPGGWSAAETLNPTTRIAVKVNGVSYLFTASTGGVTGSSQPAWPTTQYATVLDGGVTWQNQGVYYGGPGCAAQTDAWGDGCVASQALVGTVSGMVLDAAGNVYFSDTGDVVVNNAFVYHSLIRRVDAVTKMVTSVAGTGTYGYSPDGTQATKAQLAALALTMDTSGNLYFVDYGGTILRMLNTSTGTISTVAGLTTYSQPYLDNYCATGYGDGGPATAAGFGYITDVQFDPAGDIYLVDQYGCHVRRIDAATQTIHNVAGGPGQYNYINQGFGDLGQNNADGNATAATMDEPGFVRLDALANMYIASAFGGVRKVDVTQSVMNFGGAGSTAVAYNDQQVDTESTALTTTVLNAGNSGLVSFVSPFESPVWGISSSNFIRDITNPTGSADCYSARSISIGNECPVNVDFAPLTTGWLTGIDTVNDNAITGGGSQPITLIGDALGPAPSVVLLPFLLTFKAPQGGGQTQELTLFNNGATALPISSITVTGTGASAFHEEDDCNGLLAANSSCLIFITFEPPIVLSSPTNLIPPDVLTAMVSVNDTAGNSPQTAQLIGTGTLPSVQMAELTVNETLHVADNVPTPKPVVPLGIKETVHVTDGMPVIMASAALTINERIYVTDGLPGSAASVPLTINETVYVTDGMPVVGAATPLTVNEKVHVTDTMPAVAESLIVPLAETIHVTDNMPAVAESLIVPIAETIHVTDNMPTVAESLIVPIAETIHVTDNMPAVLDSLVVPILETIDLNDNMPVVLDSLVVSLLETVDVSDAPTALATSGYATHTSLIASASAVAVGGSVTLTATVTASGTMTAPTGSVNFYEDGSLLGASSLSAGATTYMASGLTAGGHAFTAIYAGSSTFAGSTSASVTVVATTLNVLTVAANSASRVFDTSNPVFGYQVTGFVNGDTSSVLSGTPGLSTPATLNSTAGGYPILAAQGTLSAPSKYALNFVPGTLTITGSTGQTILYQALPASIPRAVGTITLTMHSTSGLPITYAVTGPATVSGYTVTFTGNGTVKVTATQPGNSTFSAATPVVQSFTVTP
jgi:hypothetical protein